MADAGSSSGRGRVPRTFAVIFTIVIVAASLWGFYVYLEQTNLPPFSNQPTSHGLQLNLHADANRIASGQPIHIRISVINQKPDYNLVNNSHVFPVFREPARFAVAECSELPYGIVILSGNYTATNFQHGNPLQLFWPGEVSCPAILAIDQFSFRPYSSSAAMYSNESSPPYLGIASFSATMNLTGFWTGSNNLAEFHDFYPGVYTVVGADGWSQIYLIHFTVT